MAAGKVGWTAGARRGGTTAAATPAAAARRPRPLLPTTATRASPIGRRDGELSRSGGVASTSAVVALLQPDWPNPCPTTVPPDSQTGSGVGRLPRSRSVAVTVALAAQQHQHPLHPPPPPSPLLVPTTATQGTTTGGWAGPCGRRTIAASTSAAHARSPDFKRLCCLQGGRVAQLLHPWPPALRAATDAPACDRRIGRWQHGAALSG
mmetsp:Transcript_118850/g.383759  ORF Transcript_118850/g.383759 Transcript_118850/m.383759 type:complete len:207 (+) Transcript_118850:333-953(+)